MYQKDTEKEKLRDIERESETHTCLKDRKRERREGRREGESEHHREIRERHQLKDGETQRN